MNCKWIEVILAIIIIVLAGSSWSYAVWIVILAAAGILIHALTCKTCHVGHSMGSASMRSPSSRSRRRR